MLLACAGAYPLVAGNVGCQTAEDFERVLSWVKRLEMLSRSVFDIDAL